MTSLDDQERALVTDDIAALVEQIQQSPSRCGNVKLVTIDGPAGSGKTTLAHELAGLIAGSQVIAMDGLYNGWLDALKPELWQRIDEVILQPLTQGQVAKYDAFNWNKLAFDTPVEVAPSEIIILEGVGSSHPRIAKSSSLNVWISAPEDLLLERVLNRDGAHIRQEMLDWQLAERAYFAEFDIENSADIHLIGE